MRKFAALLAVAVLPLGALGCESMTEEERLLAELEPDITAEDVTTDAILGDLTPELLTLTERPIDAEVQIARTNNTNMRQFWNDWGHVLILDRPTRLSVYPVP